MSRLPKRYIFIDYNSLKKIKLSTLEKVCKKVFIFISHKEESIPSSIVMQAQYLGKKIKWIATDISESNGFMLHISFLMGALHEKEKRSIEFAILSDDTDFDTLVDFINDSGRNCLRVKIDNEIEEEFEEEEELFNDTLGEDSLFEEEEIGGRKMPEPARKFKQV
jgi:hypothetical protein